MTVTIRPLGPADRPHWTRLWTAYLAFPIADAGGTPVGPAQFPFHRHGWKTGNVGYRQELFAEPSVRGTGVGRALTEAVFAAAGSAGAPEVYRMTEACNTEARKLYDRIGTLTPFIEYARP